MAELHKKRMQKTQVHFYGVASFLLGISLYILGSFYFLFKRLLKILNITLKVLINTRN